MHTLMALRGVLWNLLGAVLMFAGVALIAVNAQALLQFAAVAQTHGGEVLDLGDATSSLATHQGKMVRIVAKLKVVNPPRDPEFNLSVDTPLLTRHVEMFQWREVLTGGLAAHYEVDWADHLIDANQFGEPQGHLNPTSLPLSGASFKAGQVQADGLNLSPALLSALPGSVVVAPDGSALPPNLAATFSLAGNDLLTSARADNPQLGDVRVSWEALPLGPFTIVARVDGDYLRPAQNAQDGHGYRVASGDVALLNLFPDLPTAPTAMPLMRVLAVLLAALGAWLLLAVRRSSTLVSTHSASWRPRWWSDALLALGIGALVVAAVAGAIWAGHDNLRMLYWLALAAPAAALTVWLWRRRQWRA